MNELDKKLFEAVEAGDVRQINALVERGANIRVFRDEYETLLHNAKTAEVAEALLANGAPLTDNYGASELFNIDIPEIIEVLIRHLIAQGGDVNAEQVYYISEYGQQRLPAKRRWATPLFRALSAEMAKLLIAHGADVNARNYEDETPLFMISSAEVAEVLIAHGADVNARNYEGETPLFRTSSVDVAKVLLSHGADINAVNSYGVSMLSYMSPTTSAAIESYLGKNDIPKATKTN